jgi:hypothetical protein
MFQELGPLATNLGQLGGVVVLAVCFYLLNREALKTFAEQLAAERKLSGETTDKLLQRIDNHRDLVLAKVQDAHAAVKKFHNEYRIDQAAAGNARVTDLEDES